MEVLSLKTKKKVLAFSKCYRFFWTPCILTLYTVRNLYSYILLFGAIWR